jgi:hypothetical protein
MLRQQDGVHGSVVLRWSARGSGLACMACNARLLARISPDHDGLFIYVAQFSKQIREKATRQNAFDERN